MTKNFKKSLISVFFVISRDHLFVASVDKLKVLKMKFIFPLQFVLLATVISFVFSAPIDDKEVTLDFEYNQRDENGYSYA